MKCQILFSEKNKKNITNLSSAELAKRVVKIKAIISSRKLSEILIFIFSRKHGMTFLLTGS